MEAGYFHRQPCVEERETYARRFGIHRRDKEVFGEALPVKSNPKQWTDYSGEPGLCKEDLFGLRCWARACGGVHRLTDSELFKLEQAEGARDVAYQRVKLEDGFKEI